MTPTSQISMSASRQWADRLGVWTSSLCIVHCVLTPVLLSSTAVLGHFLPTEEGVHRSLALLVGLFGSIALLIGFRKHGRRRILILMSAGLSCIAAAAWFGDMLPSHCDEVAITMLGSALMITAHRLPYLLQVVRMFDSLLSSF